MRDGLTNPASEQIDSLGLRFCFLSNIASGDSNDLGLMCVVILLNTNCLLVSTQPVMVSTILKLSLSLYECC